jgi:hypothetical protein
MPIGTSNSRRACKRVALELFDFSYWPKMIVDGTEVEIVCRVAGTDCKVLVAVVAVASVVVSVVVDVVDDELMKFFKEPVILLDCALSIELVELGSCCIREIGFHLLSLVFEWWASRKSRKSSVHHNSCRIERLMVLLDSRLLGAHTMMDRCSIQCHTNKQTIDRTEAKSNG